MRLSPAVDLSRLNVAVFLHQKTVTPSDFCPAAKNRAKRYGNRRKS